MKKILYLLIFSPALFSQEMLDEVVVSDTRTKKSIKKTGRNVIIINQKEIELKSNKLFEKSIDSHLKLKNHSDIEKKLYDKNERKNLDYLIENNTE